MAWQQIDVDSDDATEDLHKLIGRLGGMDLYFHSSGIGWENCSLDAEKEMRTVQTNAVGFTRMVLTAQREMFLQIQRKMEVMTMVPMTVGNMMMVLTIILMVIRRMMEVTTPVIMTIPDTDTGFSF